VKENAMRAHDDATERYLKIIFGNPWFMCVLTTILGTLAGWLPAPALRALIGAAGGALFGFAVGVVHFVEVRYHGTVARKRLISACIGAVTAVGEGLILAKPLPYLAVLAVIGLVLGATARDWTPHLNFV
jgi:fatty acid desaturase